MTCPSADARITPGCTGLWNDAQEAAWTRIVDFTHTHGAAKICLQLGHAGRKGVAVALNGAVVPRAGWPSRSLADADHVLVIQATQGG